MKHGIRTNILSVRVQVEVVATSIIDFLGAHMDILLIIYQSELFSCSLKDHTSRSPQWW